MAALADILRIHEISEVELLGISNRLEERTADDRRLARARANHRRRATGSAYGDVGLSKPRSGRGIGRKHLRAALMERPIPRVPRAKLLRALSFALEQSAARSSNVSETPTRMPADASRSGG